MSGTRTPTRFRPRSIAILASRPLRYARLRIKSLSQSCHGTSSGFGKQGDANGLGIGSKSFAGTVDAVFRPDAPKRYTLHVTATLDDPNHLSLRFTDWPTWNNAGRNLGKRVFKETPTRTNGETTQPRPSRSPH